MKLVPRCVFVVALLACALAAQRPTGAVPRPSVSPRPVQSAPVSRPPVHAPVQRSAPVQRPSIAPRPAAPIQRSAPIPRAAQPIRQQPQPVVRPIQRPQPSNPVVIRRPSISPPTTRRDAIRTPDVRPIAPRPQPEPIRTPRQQPGRDLVDRYVPDRGVVVRPADPVRTRPIVTPVQPDRDGSVISVPPRRRTVPFDDRPTLRDGYRTAPVAPGTPVRQRQRYERDLDRATPAPTLRPSPNRGEARDRATLQPRPNAPVVRPDAPARARVTPRYQPPPGRSLGRTPVVSRSSEFARDGRHRAPWTFGRSSRFFHGRGPWGVNAAGRRTFGFWRGAWCSPHAFSWCYVPSWCRWGFFSWSAWSCSYWPRYYDWCSFGWYSSIGYWSSYHPYYPARHHLWYWPGSVYAPVTVYAAGYDSGYYDDAPADVTIRIEDGREAVIESGGGAVRVERAPPSKETLAARHVTLADGYFREGRYQDAVDAYLRALTYLPDDASIHLALADGLFALGDYHYAAFMIGKALELDPTLATVVIDKRKFYSDPSKFDAQVDTLRRYTEEKPYDAAALLVLAVNLRFGGDAAGAERALARVLEIDKDHAAAELLLQAIRSEKAATERK